jgi:alkanesulfonate monooxygenase SsuD/methylene tetrahydromethanopterin reductase-like flavin-dependent oxidoreductase (luciferase family)
MKAIWTQDESSYHGKFVNFDPIWCYPKPVQKPWPPIIIGGQAPAAKSAAITWCDGWMPTVRGEAFFSKLGEFRELLAQSSRDPKTLSIGAYYEPTGNLDQDRCSLARFAEAGVDRVSSWVPPESRDKALANVELWSKLIDR